MGEEKNKRKIGAYYEEKAALGLEKSGRTILARNFRTRYSEIDIVALEGETLLFVEVKYRTGGKKGSPFEAVTAEKQKRIVSGARYFLMKYGYPETTPVRFDVIGIEDGHMRLIKNAFDAF